MDAHDDFRRIMVERASLSECCAELGGVVLSRRPQALGFERRRLRVDSAPPGERVGGSGFPSGHDPDGQFEDRAH